MAKKKVLKKAAPASGAAATRAAEAKKVAEMRKAAGDPVGMTSSRGQPTTASKVMGMSASSAGPVAGDGTSMSASSAEAAKADTE
jgi:hypothetical protein